MTSISFQTHYSFEKITYAINFCKNYIVKNSDLQKFFVSHCFLSYIVTTFLSYFLSNKDFSFHFKKNSSIIADKKNDLYAIKHRGHQMKSNRIATKLFYSFPNISLFYSASCFFCNEKNSKESEI